MIYYGKLSTGLRLVAIHTQSPVEHCGVAINAGSRDESAAQYGLAHFVEHTIFKGTDRRRSWHILNRMEAVGGELIAYTTKEETLLYSTFPAGNLRRATELISDLVTNSRFPTAELDKERLVVADEIDSYLDVPSEGIFDRYEELIFAGSAMAHNILGDKCTLDNFTSEVCRNYLETFYTPGEMVFFYSGPEKPDRVFKIADTYFKDLTRQDVARQRSIPPIVTRFNEHEKIDSHQAHTVMGARVCGMKDPDRYRMALLTNMLGGPGMNSILNVVLRERRGLVYTIDASTAMMSDTGLFTIYFGCDVEDVGKCTGLVERTMGDLLTDLLTSKRVEDAKKQYAGQLIVASVNSEQTAINVARSVLYRGSAMTRDEVADAIRSVTHQDVIAAAHHLQSLSTLTLS